MLLLIFIWVLVGCVFFWLLFAAHVAAHIMRCPPPQKTDCAIAAPERMIEPPALSPREHAASVLAAYHARKGNSQNGS